MTTPFSHLSFILIIMHNSCNIFLISIVKIFLIYTFMSIPGMNQYSASGQRSVLKLLLLNSLKMIR